MENGFLMCKSGSPIVRTSGEKHSFLPDPTIFKLEKHFEAMITLTMLAQKNRQKKGT